MGERDYGHGIISKEGIEALLRLSKKTNAWVVFDNETEETALTLEQWKQKFNQDIEKNSELLKG